MHRIELLKGKDSYKIDIEFLKIIYGNDFHSKYEMYSIIKNHFLKITNSEFSIENLKRRSVFFDEKPLDVKYWKFIDINPFFDFESDMKLGTKSLLLKYLETFSDELQNSELFNTLSILYNSLNDEFFNENIEVDIGEDKKIDFSLNELNKSILFKEVVAKFLFQGYEANQPDLSYEDTILFQLKLAYKIAEKSPDKYVLVYSCIPNITSKIYKEILSFKLENAFLIVDTNTLINIDVKKLISLSKYYIDFANNEMINDIIMELPFHILREELIEKVNLYLKEPNKYENDLAIIEIFNRKKYNKNS